MKFIYAFLILLITAQAQAVTRYVGKTGSGGAPGNDAFTCNQSESDTTVKITIVAGLNCMAAGDTLIVRDGVYVETITNQMPSGSSDAARTIVRSLNDWGAIIRPAAGAIGIWRQGSPRQYYTIQGFDFDGVDCMSLANGNCGGFSTSSATDGAFHHVRVTGNRFRNMNSDGIQTSGTDFLEITNNVFQNIAQSNNGLSHGIYIAGSSDGNFSTRVTISGNSLDSCGGYCIHLYTVPTPHREVIVTRNFAKNCGFLVGQSCYVLYADDAVVSYNISTGTTGDAGILRRSGSRMLFHNNTTNHPGQPGIQIENGPAGTCRNNLMLGSGSTFNGTCSTSSNNLTGQTAASHVVNAAGDDFSLVSTSTATNAGTTNIGTVTFGGVSVNVTVPFNLTAPSIGAHQKLGGVDCVVANATPTKIDCTVQNNAFPDILPATGITGWTVTGKTVASNVRAGTNGFQITTTAPFVAGTCALSYAQTGNLTDSALIGSSSNQELFAQAATCTNNVSSGAPVAVVTQSHGAMYAWDGSESSGAQIGAANPAQAFRAMVFGKFLARYGLKTTVAATAPTNYAKYYSLNGAGYAVLPTQTGALPVGVCDAPGVSASNTIQRLTSGSFVAGRVVEIGAGVPTITMTTGDSTELLYPICFGPGLSAGDNIKFRIYKDTGVALDAYDTNATLNIDVVAPGLSGL